METDDRLFIELCLAVERDGRDLFVCDSQTISSATPFLSEQRWFIVSIRNYSFDEQAVTKDEQQLNVSSTVNLKQRRVNAYGMGFIPF